MKGFNKFIALFAIALFSVNIYAQTPEPEFVGEAYWEKEDGSFILLGKEYGAYTRGISMKANSFDALSLELDGRNAKTRVPAGQTMRIIVRATDNNSDPLSIINVIRFDSKKNKRTTVLSENNSGTLMKSRTNNKNQMMFNGKKYETTSYLIQIDCLEEGEYGIIVSNPNGLDQKRTIVSCFGVDK